MSARRLWALALAAGLVLGPTTPAWAHGGTSTSGYSNYRTRVLGIEPAVPGLAVEVMDVDGGLHFTNTGTQDVIVLGYEDEPYLRVGPSGVYANLNSQATYVNGRRDANVPVPERARVVGSEPEWYQLSTGRSARWHDHRVHWMGSIPPPETRAEPGREHVIFPRWVVPVMVGEQRVEVYGDLRWLPPPRRTSWLFGALGVLVAVLALLQVPAWNRSATQVAGSVGAAAAVVLVAGRVGASRAGLGAHLLAFTVPAVALAAALSAWWWRRSSGRKVLVASLLGGLVLVALGAAYLAMLEFSQIQSTIGPVVNRLLQVTVLGVGAALVVNAVVRWFDPRSAVAPGSYAAPDAEAAAP